jgi:hypothetical protein
VILVLLPKPKKTLLRGPVSGSKCKSKAGDASKDANMRINALEAYISEKIVT